MSYITPVCRCIRFPLVLYHVFMLPSSFFASSASLIFRTQMWSTPLYQWNIPQTQMMKVAESSVPLTTPPTASLRSWCPTLFPRIPPPSWASPPWVWVHPLSPHSLPNLVCSSKEPNPSTMKWRHAVRLWSRPGLSPFLPLACQQEATGSTPNLLITALAPGTTPPQGARGWRTRRRTCGTPHTAPGFWKTSGGRRLSLTLSPCRSRAPPPPPPPPTLRHLRPAVRLGVTVPASAPPQHHPLPASFKLPRARPPIKPQQVAA